MSEEKKPGGQSTSAPDDFDDDAMVEEDGGAPQWIVTFADLVTLLMVFFILLFAMGTIEEQKFRQLKASLSSALGTDTLPEAGTREGLDVIKDSRQEKLDDETISAVDEVGAMVAKEIDEIASEVDEFVFKNKMTGQVEVSSDERGAVITISDVILFPAGKAKMSSEGQKKLKQMFELLKQFNYHVKIEGHTDNSPIHTAKFPSNWELSASRAADVARLFIREGFPPEKISVEGFAEFRPKVPNDSLENRAVNRRIEVVYQRGSIRKRMVNVLGQN